MIFIPILSPKIELSAFFRSAEPVKEGKKKLKIYMWVSSAQARRTRPLEDPREPRRRGRPID